MGIERHDSTTAPAADKDSSERRTAGRLALEVMHEIRNPLDALGHLTYLAMVEADNAQKVREYLSEAQEQMGTVRAIIDQTLGYARPPVVHQVNDLAQLAEAALRIHQRTLSAKKIHLVKDLPNVAAEVHGIEIIQVVSNLVVNALDALPSDGTLAVRLRKRKGSIHLVIADNGHGIPADVTAAVFEPFFTTKGEQGTGLGLALSKAIVERYGGSIGVRSSVRPGRSGTIFRISLPL